MKLIIHRENIGYAIILLLPGLLLGAGGGYAYLALHERDMAIALAVSSAVLIFTSMFSTKTTTVLEFNEQGIMDARLGFGLIPWSEIENVQIEATYGNRFLCLQVRRPEMFLNRLAGDRREKALFHQSLMFRRFNIEIGSLDVSLLTLKEYIETRIADHRPTLSQRCDGPS